MQRQGRDALRLSKPLKTPEGRSQDRRFGVFSTLSSSVKSSFKVITSTMLRRRAVLVTAALIVPGIVLFSALKPSVPVATAAPSTYLNFQARLMASAGNLVPDGTYNVEFKLYNAVSSSGSSQGSCSGDANCVWTETRISGNKVNVVNGYLSVTLGSVTAFSGIDWSQQHWLTMNIGGTGSPGWDGEMTPRILLTAVPLAFVANNVASGGTNAASTNSSNVSIQSGNAAGATSNSGNITVDTGTATGTTGTISLGATNASALILGRSGLAVSVPGTLSIGVASSSTGTLGFRSASGSGSITLTPASPGSTAYTITIPAETGTICTTAIVCAGYGAGSGAFINLQASTPGTQQTGHLNISGTGIFGGNITAGGGTVMLGAASQAGSLVVSDGSSNTATLSFAASTGDPTFQLPAAPTGTYDICTTLIVCAGYGAGTGSFVNLQASTPGTQQTGHLNVSGTGIFGGGISVTGATTSINASSNFATNINTGSSTGAVSIGNSAAGAIAIQSASTVGLTGTTTITGLTTGVALAISNSSSTGNILNLQDNATVVMSVADGGAALFQNSTNSTTAFLIQNSSGADALRVDTSTTVNLISNPGFAVNTTGWAALGSAGIARTTSFFMHDRAGLALTTTAAANDGVKFNYSLTSSTSFYYLTFYARLSSGTMSTFQVGRSEDGSAFTTCGTISLTATWQRYNCGFATGTVSGSPFIYFRQTDASARTIYIDSVQLEQSSSGQYSAFNGAGLISIDGPVRAGIRIQQVDDTENNGLTIYGRQDDGQQFSLYRSSAATSVIDAGHYLTVLGYDNATIFATGSGSTYGSFGLATPVFSSGLIALSPSAGNNALGVQAAASQASDLVHLQDSSGNVNATFNATGAQLTLGRVAASGTVTQGKLLFSDGTTDNFSLTLQSAILSGSSKVITFPNETGTVCTTATVCAGYGAGSGAFVNLQASSPGTPQTGHLNITGTGILGTALGVNATAFGTVEKLRVNTPTTTDNLTVASISTGATTSKGLVIQGVASQAANLLELQSSTGAVLARFNSAGALCISSSTDCTGTTRQTISAAGFDSYDNGGSISTSFKQLSNDQFQFGVGSSSNYAGVRFLGPVGASLLGQNSVTVRGSTSQTGKVFEVQNVSSVPLFNISTTGAAFFKNSTDSTSAFTVQNLAGTALFNVDTTNGVIKIAQDSWFAGVDAAGTGTVNILKVNANNEIQFGAALNVDGGIVFPTNAGQITFTDLPIDATATAGTKESYSLRVGSANVLTVYGEADGSGNLQNGRVAIGSSISPAYTLDVGGTLGVSGAAIISSTLVVQGASITSGTSGQAGSLIVSDGSSSTITIKSATQVAATNYDISVPAITANDTFCLVTLANCSGGAGANAALSNLAAVAINTSLLPATDDSIDLGDNTHRFRDAYLGGETLHIGASTTDEGTISYDATANILQFGTDTTTMGGISIGGTTLTGTITVGQSTATNTINIGSANVAATAMQTITIGGGTTGGTSGGLTLNLGTGIPAANAAKAINIGTDGTTTGAVNIILGSNGGAAHTTLIQGGFNSQAIRLQAAGGGTITIGSQTASTVNTILIGAAGSTTNANNISINNTSGTNAGTITIGGSGTATGTITLGQSTATNTISIGSANGSSATQTINLGAGTSTTSGGKAINIGTGTPGASTTNDIAIGNGGTTTGTVGVTIGSVGAAAHTTLIQGGNGIGAVSLQAATNGFITIGTTNNNAIVVGNTTTTSSIIIGQSSAGTSGISIGSANATAATQTIDIGAGTSATSGGKTVNIANGVPGASTTNTVAIGTAGTTTGTVGITIGSIGAANHTLLLQGGNVATAGSEAIRIQTADAGAIAIGTSTQTGNIIIGQAATASQAVTIQGANGTGTVQTVNIGTGTSTTSGGKIVNIATGIPGASTNNIVSIGTGGTTTGTVTVSMGSIGAANHTLLLQGGNVNTAGSEAIRLQTAAAGGIAIGTAAQTGTITLGQATTASTQIINIQSANGSSSTQTINIGGGSSTTSGGKVVNIGNGSPGASTTNTIAIGTGGGSTGTVSVTIGTNNGAGHVTLIQGGNGTGASAAIRLIPDNAGQINIGGTLQTGGILVGQSTGTQTVSIANGNGSSSTQTVNINAGTSSTSGGKVVNIGTGAPGTGTTNDISIGTGGTTSAGTVGITIGSVTAAAHTTLIQGGNTASAIRLIVASGGSINIGNGAVASTIQIGNVSGAVGQTINVGTNATASSSTALTLGSTISTSATTIQAGSGNINLTAAVAATSTLTVSARATVGGASNQAQLVVKANASQGNTALLSVVNSSSVEISAVRTPDNSSIALGYNAGFNLTTSQASVYVGSYSGDSSTGQNNTGVGYSTLEGITTSTNNAAFGAYALATGVAGSYNAAFGAQTLQASTGTQNTALGFGAGNAVTSGNNNVLVGFNAGDNITNGSNNVIIGFDLNASSASVSNELRLAGVLQGNTSTLAAQFNGTLTILDTVTIGTADATGTLLVLDSKTTSGDPTGVTGAMYYNVNYAKFRCFENGSWINCSDPSALSNGIYLYEDFFSVNVANSDAVGTHNWTNNNTSGCTASNLSYQNAPSTDRPGTLELSTGTASSTGCNVLKLGNNNSWLIGGDTTVETAISVPALSTGAQEAVFRVGMQDDDNSPSTDGIYWEYDRTVSTNWSLVSAQGGTRTTIQNTNGACSAGGTPVAVSAGSWVSLKWVLNAARTEIDGYINNVFVGCITTNIPNTTTQFTSPKIALNKTAGTGTARTLDIDYFSYVNPITTKR